MDIAAATAEEVQHRARAWDAAAALVQRLQQQQQLAGSNNGLLNEEVELLGFVPLEGAGGSSGRGSGQAVLQPDVAPQQEEAVRAARVLQVSETRFVVLMFNA